MTQNHTPTPYRADGCTIIAPAESGSASVVAEACCTLKARARGEANAGFIWNTPNDPVVLGIHVHTDAPETVLFAPTATLLSLLNIDPGLVTP